MCSRCADVTAELERNNRSSASQRYDFMAIEHPYPGSSDNNTEFRLPHGLFLNNLYGKSGPGTNASKMTYMTMRGMSDPNETVAMRDLGTLIWSQTIIAVDVDSPSSANRTWPDFEVTASECALYYCAREHNTEYKDSLLSMTSKELKSYKRDPESWSTDYVWGHYGNISNTTLECLAWHPQDSFIPHEYLSLKADDDATSVWNVSSAAVFGISYYMQSVFAACLNGNNCTQALPLSAWNATNGYLVSVSGRDWGSTTGRSEVYRPALAKVMFAASTTQRGLEQKFESIAASMSNVIR